jgi:protein-S-isoprenylcysteine O-methyltransferase Ste14
VTGGRLAYGALFVAVLPAGLVLWARAAAPAVPLPPVSSLPAGIALVAAGFSLMIAGGRDLIVRGGGLPMNAFPPPCFVHAGIYRWIRNPMYIGFGLACAGTAIAAGSAAGLWLVTPVVALASAALVFGYERHDLRRRFGDDALRPPLLSLPRDDEGSPAVRHRAAVYVWVLIPWLLTFYAMQALGRAPDAFGTMLPFERHWRVVQWTEVVYASAYVFIPIAPLLIRTRRDLRRFAIQGGIATAVVTLAWITIPVVATNRAFVASSGPGRMLAFEQAHSNGVAAFPAFHVLWALIVAQAWQANANATRRVWWYWIGWTWAVAIAVSCLTTSMHTVIEVGTAACLFVPIRGYEAAWAAIRHTAELVANSWHEWRFGPVRMINHGAWAAAAGGAGLLIAGSAAGPDRLAAVVWIAVCVLLGAGLWAQALEGSSQLLRPFGWYGGIIGGLFGAFTARAAGVPILPLLAAFAVAAPWIQILGRVRCLVQGCCHGGAASPDVGIRYLHRRSRVTQLAHLAGAPIHATPLYSIAGNIVVGAVLLRLRVLGAADALVVGVFLILGSVARFVEESYRAEPQTPTVAGLHSYQWIAIASLMSGIVCTTLPSTAPPAGFTAPAPHLLWSALGVALLAGAAMGMDFPQSNHRFSRLAAGD